MAETAKILNPHKIVVLPDKDAGCSLEASCPADKLKALQDTNPNFYTIAYINCSADVKALSDVICTSGNAVKIVNAAPKEKDLLFVPDENLGAWVMEQTGRPMTLWRGNCYVHVEFTHASISRIRREYPGAPLVAHPECTKAVRMLADEVCSTEKMVSYCKSSSAREIIIATEAGMLHRLQRECPDKIFIPAPSDICRCNECRFMKMNTLEKLHDCMENLEPRIELSPAIIAARSVAH
jgi:quinolinate synthase